MAMGFVKTRGHVRKGTTFLVKMVQHVNASPLNSLTKGTNRKLKMLQLGHLTEYLKTKLNTFMQW